MSQRSQLRAHIDMSHRGRRDPHPEGVQRYEHDGLDSDAAQDVADRDVDLPVERRGERDRDLGQVRRHGQ